MKLGTVQDGARCWRDNVSMHKHETTPIIWTIFRPHPLDYKSTRFIDFGSLILILSMSVAKNSCVWNIAQLGCWGTLFLGRARVGPTVHGIWLATSKINGYETK